MKNEFLLNFLTHKIALPLLKLIRKPEKFNFSLSDLEQFEKNTVGYALFKFITTNNLKLLPYYAKHDIKHVLLNYDTTAMGETSLQCFMLGNGRVSFPVMATVLYGLATMPFKYKLFLNAFKRGQSKPNISNIIWEKVVYEDLKQTRIKYKL